jgi:hypothetical protein
VVKVVDSTGAIVASIPFTGQFEACALNPAAHRLYIGASGFQLFVIDTNQNAVVNTVTLPHFSLFSVAVNPLTGNIYLGMNDGNGVTHVQVYSGTGSNSLIADLSSNDHPELTDAQSIAVNSLTNTVYVGGDRGNNTAAAAIIDGLTNAVSALPPSPFETIAHALAIDFGNSLLAGGGYDYTNLWPATSDVTAQNLVPIAMGFQGVKDGLTIATKPLFRTRNTTPSVVITATSNFPQGASALVPKQAFYQVDGWQGTWQAVKLTPQNNITSAAKVKLPTLATGQHILYAYSSVGDIATVQSQSFGENSPALSPIGSFVFTVEQ